MTTLLCSVLLLGFAHEGNTISIIDVENPTVEAARALVGTTDPNVQTRPFIPSFTPDGKEIVVPNFRANNVSIIDLQTALANPAKAVVAAIPLVRPADADGAVRAARPKGSAVTADGRYAAISGEQERRPTRWPAARSGSST